MLRLVRRATTAWFVICIAWQLFANAAPAFAFHFPWDQGHDTFRPDDPDDQDNPPEEENPSCGGDPVNLKSGNFLYSAQDVVVPGVGPMLAVLRSYNSQDRHNGPFGVGWSTTLTERIVVASDGLQTVAIVHGANGKRKRFVFDPREGFQAPAGSSETLVAAADGSIAIRAKAGSKRVFDATGALSRIEDRNGNSIVLDHDATGFVTAAREPTGRALLFTKGANGKVAAVQDPRGNSVLYEYDAGGRLVRVTDAANAATTYAYDARDNLASITDAAGVTVLANTYDVSDRVVSQRFPDGVIQFAYLGPDQTQVTDARGNRTLHHFNSCGNPTVTTDPLGRTTSADWDADFNATRVTDGNGHTTTYGYDAYGDLLLRTDPLGRTTRMTYEATFGQLTSVIDAAGRTTTLQYDAQGNLTAVRNPAGHLASATYDNRGLITTVTNALGKTSRYEYDASGYRTTSTDALGQVTTFTYDAMGNVVSVRDADGRSWSYTYDALNRLVESRDPTGAATSFTYDARGNPVASTDQNGQTTTWEYDARNRRVKTTNPLGEGESIGYDPNGNRTQVTTRNGATLVYTYDAGNQLTGISESGQSLAQFAYDAAGSMIQASNPDSVLAFSFDAANQLVSVSTEGSPYQPAVTISYGYDAIGNRTSMTDTILGSTTIYAYDAAARLVSLSDPHGDVVGFEHDDAGRTTAITYPNGVRRSYTYDAAGRVAQIMNAMGATTLSSFGYAYAASGARRQLDALRGGSGVPRTLTYAYDAVDRLLQATTPRPGGLDESFTYDAVGNRLTRDGTAVTSTFDAANRILASDGASYRHDENGNLVETTSTSSGHVRRYAYDVLNRLVGVQEFSGMNGAALTSVVYRYDALGRRIAKDIDGVVTAYVYDREDLMLEFDGAGALQASYAHGPGLDEPLIMYRGGQRRFYVADALGSVTELVDDVGQVVQQYTYDAFGRTVAGSGSEVNPFRFTGREYDAETGLYFLRARYYDPALGRFLSADPIGFGGGEVNLYAYVGNNPATFTDPLGLQKGSSEHCLRLLEKISNVRERIQKRIGELDEDPLGLPETCPGDKLKPSLSRAGHRLLINADKALLAALQAEYLAFCSQQPPGGTPAPEESFFDLKYWERITGLTGAALIAYLLLSEGSRIFPPRNAIPLP